MDKKTPCNVEDARAKRQRLVALCHGSSYVSKRGIAQTCANIRRFGVPDASSKTTLLRTRHKEATRMTSFGELTHEFVLPLTTNGDTAISVQNPLAMLSEACQRSGFAPIFLEAIKRTPPSIDRPWSILIYNDGIAHNPFASGEDERKCEGVYWTMVELGMSAIHSENAWFVVAAVRATIVKDLAGGVSHLDKLLLKRLFFNPSTGNDLSNGIQLDVKGQDDPVWLFAKVHAFVADGDALKHLQHSKGSSGFKECFCCDVVDHTSPNTDGYTPSTCLDDNLITFSDDAMVYAIYEEIRVLTRNADAEIYGAKTRLANASKHLGWNYHPDCIFLDADLKALGIGPVSSCMYDWFHIYVVGGIINFELFFLLMFFCRRSQPRCKQTLVRSLWVGCSPRHKARSEMLLGRLT